MTTGSNIHMFIIVGAIFGLHEPRSPDLEHPEDHHMPLVIDAELIKD